jgi:transposase
MSYYQQDTLVLEMHAPLMTAISIFISSLYMHIKMMELEPIIEAAKSIKSHWMGIINYAETKISNGVMEGINSMVQSAKSSARCFRTTKNFIITIYLRMGKLEFYLPM